MKTTINIPDNELQEAIRLSGAKTKKDAILTALRDYNKRHKTREATKLFGTFVSLESNEEIEKRLSF